MDPLSDSDSPLTQRDLELIEVALESAISAVGSGFTASDNRDMTDLASEYRHALAGVRKMGKGVN